MKKRILVGYRVRIEPAFADVSTLSDDIHDGITECPEKRDMDVLCKDEGNVSEAIHRYFHIWEAAF
jgi:hypothetical protein